MRGDRLARGLAPGGHLDQQRVVVRRDDRAGIGGAAVETHAEAGGAAIGGHAAVVRREIVFRILGGDAALQRMAVQADFSCGGTRPPRGHWRRLDADLRAFADADLRLDDVDAGDLLR